MTVSLSLTDNQYEEIMTEIRRNHRFGQYPFPANHKCIKYIRPNWDMRDGKCFLISFDDKKFSPYDSTIPMFDRILKWLESK